MNGYDQSAAVAYAHAWAFDRNPVYGAFDEMGGDCANFVSQCLFAGCGRMNFAPDGWFYRSMRERSPAWTGVFFQSRFLLSNTGPGPYGERVPLDQARPGDVFQIAFVERRYTHSGLIVAVDSPDPSGIRIAAHTVDCDNRALDTYPFQSVRVIAIRGARA